MINKPIIYNNSALFTSKHSENNELQPIITVSVNRVLLKIDLRMEHVLIRVRNRNRFHMTHVPKRTDF